MQTCFVGVLRTDWPFRPGEPWLRPGHTQRGVSSWAVCSSVSTFSAWSPPSGRARTGMKQRGPGDARRLIWPGTRTLCPPVPTLPPVPAAAAPARRGGVSPPRRVLASFSLSFRGHCGCACSRVRAWHPGRPSPGPRRDGVRRDGRAVSRRGLWRCRDPPASFGAPVFPRVWPPRSVPSYQVSRSPGHHRRPGSEVPPQQNPSCHPLSPHPPPAPSALGNRSSVFHVRHSVVLGQSQCDHTVCDP